jgi:hypothetical protein
MVLADDVADEACALFVHVASESVPAPDDALEDVKDWPPPDTPIDTHTGDESAGITPLPLAEVTRNRRVSTTCALARQESFT